jgi:ABC-type uncharacterized transport system substrate-binding protein
MKMRRIIFASHARLSVLLGGRIFNGERPSDTPVMQATKFYPTINLKAANVFVLNIPLPLLGCADENYKMRTKVIK